MIPLASRTNELAPSAPTTHRALTVRVSPVRASLPGLVFGDPPERELDPLVGLHEPFGRPPALDRHPGGDACMVVDRPLELRLEEHVVGLPPGRRRAAGLEAQQQLTVGAEPAVVVDRNHLVGQHLGQPERLQQPHDLVIEVHRARETVDLGEALEHRHPMPGAAEQRRERLPDRAVADDRDVEFRLVGVIDCHSHLHVFVSILRNSSDMP